MIIAPTENERAVMGMAKYIDRERAIDAAVDVYYNTPDIDLSCEKFEAAILNIQAADVAPVRHAKVIDKISDDHETIKPWDYRYYCSACKIPMRDSWNNYCPNCGAKMDGE